MALTNFPTEAIGGIGETGENNSPHRGGLLSGAKWPSEENLRQSSFANFGHFLKLKKFSFPDRTNIQTISTRCQETRNEEKPRKEPTEAN